MTDVIAAHKHSFENREAIRRSDSCGCFHCLAIFEPTAITHWVDEPPGTPDDQRNGAGLTAMCPRCAVDSVLGNASGYPLTAEFLGQMAKHWFGDGDES